VRGAARKGGPYRDLGQVSLYDDRRYCI